jgi:predicted alpha/beta-fold hydrolase
MVRRLHGQGTLRSIDPRLTSSLDRPLGNSPSDYRSAIHYIHSTYPNAPLLGCGFSLGAGVLARFIGEEGTHCVLKAGVVVAAPWDCPGMSRRLDATWFSRNVYSKAMGQNILNIYLRILGSPPPPAALTPSSTRPPSPSSPRADGASWVHPIARPDSRLFKHVATLAKMKRPLLREIDECVVREVGGNSPPFPFPSAEAYYEWASPKHRLPGIKMWVSLRLSAQLMSIGLTSVRLAQPDALPQRL